MPSLSLRPAIVELVVDDMAATLAFYRLLGLDVPDGAETEPHVDVEFGGLRLAFDTVDTVRSFEPDWTPPTGGHRCALAFEASLPQGVDDAYAAIVAAGHTGRLAPWDAFWGMRYAVVHDPDGSQVDLFALLPS